MSSSSDFGWTRTYDKLRFKITDNSTDKNSVDEKYYNIRMGESVNNLDSKQWKLYRFN